MGILSDKITLNLDGNAEVNVNGFIAPIEYTQYDFHVKWDALANLRVAESEKRHPASVFCDFLPKEAVSIGIPWAIKHIGVLRLLEQLHPSPSLDMRVDARSSMKESQGLWACLRAYNDEYADIVFRIHTEFALKGGWFTPSQFTGHLIIDRIRESVVFFQMYVPKTTLNFDVNWKGPVGSNVETWITDIGFCPQMELRAGIEDVLPDIEFAESITQKEVEHKLILCFYKSQHINWVSLAEALEMAPVQQKPIHALSIDGPLADESC